jgi:hypothetical protein
VLPGKMGSPVCRPAIPDRALDFGAGVAVDFHADGDFDHARGFPGHVRLLIFNEMQCAGTRTDAARKKRSIRKDREKFLPQLPIYAGIFPDRIPPAITSNP